MDLFEQQARRAMGDTQPLAERMRPQRLNDCVGQQHVIGPGAIFKRAIENDRLFSMILWGPPGCGKTTLARIIADETKAHFMHFSAVLSGVKDIRAVIDTAREQRRMHRRRTILFVDEIHRFNKAQQDAFLHHVESGLIILVGATTENPSFEVIAPLLSRCRVITLNMLSDDEIGQIIDRALEDEENGLGSLKLTFAPEAREHLIRISNGDARSALNSLEITAGLIARTEDKSDDKWAGRLIGLEEVEKALQHKALVYDKGGEEHYNLISALHKSMRDSDPDATLYWLERMLTAGEDPLFVARRMVRFASEDIGNADPRALRVALDAKEAFHFLGHPEGELALAQAALYLAAAPKSNRVYVASKKVRSIIGKTGALPVPHHIRNAPTRLMKDLGYGRGYRYAHDFEDAVVDQEHLPSKLKGMQFYEPSDRGMEKEIRDRLKAWLELKAKGKKS
jgi:putative ATPase